VPTFGDVGAAGAAVLDAAALGAGACTFGGEQSDTVHHCSFGKELTLR
jgi:hypothetical protein